MLLICIFLQMVINMQPKTWLLQFYIKYLCLIFYINPIIKPSLVFMKVKSQKLPTDENTNAFILYFYKW